MARKANKRNEVTVKMDADVYRVVRTVAAWRGINVSEYLTEIAGPPARRDMERMHRETAKVADAAKEG